MGEEEEDPHATHLGKNVAVVPRRGGRRWESWVASSSRREEVTWEAVRRFAAEELDVHLYPFRTNDYNAVRRARLRSVVGGDDPPDDNDDGQNLLPSDGIGIIDVSGPNYFERVVVPFPKNVSWGGETTTTWGRRWYPWGTSRRMRRMP